MRAATAPLPRAFRAAAGARRVLGARGTRLLYGSPAIGPLRRLLGAAAPRDPQLIEVCGGPLRGARMYVDLSCEKYYWLGTHEEAVQQALIGQLAPGAVAYDIGAHAGFFSLLMSRHAGADGRVIAFEPHAANVARLRANITADGAANVEVWPAALSDVCGEARFLPHASSLEGMIDDDREHPDARDSRALTERVRVTTIDAAVAAGAPVPDLMKIDVEGAEGGVIRGGRQTIALHAPVIIMEVHSTGAWDEVLEALPVAYAFTALGASTDASRGLPGHYVGLPRAGRRR
jgi:FkbM family methyltransferase